MAAALVTAAAWGFENVAVEDTIPSFELRTVDGRKFDSAKRLKGRVTVVVFWRLGQKYSEPILRDLQALYDERADDGLEVVAICAGDVASGAVAAVADKLGVRFPVLVDPERIAYGRFGVIVAPVTGFVDDRGTLRFYYPSYRRDFPSTARAHVDFLLGKMTEAKHSERVRPRASVKENFNRAEPRYRLGLQFLRRGDTDSARELLVKAWEADEPFVAAGVELGLLLLREGRDEEALKILREVEGKAPQDPRMLSGKGVALLRTGREEEGKEILERVVERRPKDPMPYYELGIWFERHGDYEEAARLFKAGLEALR